MSERKLNCLELVELRLLQQGRCSCVDGRNGYRMVVGTVATAGVFCSTMIALPQNAFSLAIAWILLFTGLGATVAWIIRSDEKATAARLSELESIAIGNNA